MRSHLLRGARRARRRLALGAQKKTRVASRRARRADVVEADRRVGETPGRVVRRIEARLDERHAAHGAAQPRPAHARRSRRRCRSAFRSRAARAARSAPAPMR